MRIKFKNSRNCPTTTMTTCFIHTNKPTGNTGTVPCNTVSRNSEKASSQKLLGAKTADSSIPKSATETISDGCEDGGDDNRSNNNMKECQNYAWQRVCNVHKKNRLHKIRNLNSCNCHNSPCTSPAHSHFDLCECSCVRNFSDDQCQCVCKKPDCRCSARPKCCFRNCLPYSKCDSKYFNPQAKCSPQKRMKPPAFMQDLDFVANKSNEDLMFNTNNDMDEDGEETMGSEESFDCAMKEVNFKAMEQRNKKELNIQQQLRNLMNQQQIILQQQQCLQEQLIRQNDILEGHCKLQKQKSILNINKECMYRDDKQSRVKFKLMTRKCSPIDCHRPTQCCIAPYQNSFECLNSPPMVFQQNCGTTPDSPQYEQVTSEVLNNFGEEDINEFNDTLYQVTKRCGNKNF